MIYFTEISRDKTGKQDESELITFQFMMHELPESIKFPLVTKVNHIEYNGGFHTNQIMGVFPKEVEWEGCFFGTYTDDDLGRISAKERSDKIKEFMGRPIRVGFAVPQGADSYIPGEDDGLQSSVGSTAKESKLNGEVGIYIIEEYDIDIINYSNINYRIKLTPHQRQEKIKPTTTTNVAIKLNTDAISKAANAGSAAARPKKAPFGKAKVALGKSLEAGNKIIAPKTGGIRFNAHKDTFDASKARAAAEAKAKAKPVPPGTSGKSKPIKL